MHEHSDTIQGRDKQWYNVYGQDVGATQPMPLPPVFSFEQPSYSTVEEAVNKAAWRSQMGHGQYPDQPPQYGIQPQQPTDQSLMPLVMNIFNWLFGPQR